MKANAGDFAPRPGAASLPRMLLAQTEMETRLLLLNGEQLLLTVVIPTLFLIVFSTIRVVDLGSGHRVDFVVPGIFALAVMSTAFTGQAIATAFERRYGVLKRVGATPLPRWAFILAKSGSVMASEVVQLVLLTVVGLLLGWGPKGSIIAVVVLLLLGTAAFSGLGLLMAGTLRAEATLPAANLIFILLLGAGGVVVPLDRFPAAAQGALGLLPITALAHGLREVLQHGNSLPLADVGILATWAVIAVAAAAALFRWE